MDEAIISILGASFFMGGVIGFFFIVACVSAPEGIRLAIAIIGGIMFLLALFLVKPLDTARGLMSGEKIRAIVSHEDGSKTWEIIDAPKPATQPATVEKP